MNDDKLRRLVAMSCALRGCTCDPDVDLTTDHEGRFVAASIAHDRTCRTIAEPSWN